VDNRPDRAGGAPARRTRVKGAVIKVSHISTDSQRLSKRINSTEEHHKKKGQEKLTADCRAKGRVSLSLLRKMKTPKRPFI